MIFASCSKEKLNEIANDIVKSGVTAVILIGGGEPMAHPEFGTIVDYFYDNDIHVGVTSNGTLIDKYFDSLAFRTKWVRISVDAGCEEVFQQYRPHISGKSQFNKVIDGIKNLARSSFDHPSAILKRRSKPSEGSPNIPNSSDGFFLFKTCKFFLKSWP